MKLLKILKESREELYYFAYGSNMNAEYFNKTYPGANAVKLVCLRDYDLRFDKWSRRHNGTVADVVPETGENVFGIAYHFPKKYIKQLDKQEGGYTKVTATAVDGVGTEYNIFFYVVNNKSEEESLPKSSYIRYIVDGLNAGSQLNNFSDSPHHDQLVRYSDKLRNLYKLSQSMYSMQESANAAPIAGTKPMISKWLDRAIQLIHSKWNNLRSLTNMEKDETIEAAKILQRMFKGETVSEKEKRFMQSQSKDLMKILSLISLSLIPIPIPLTAIAAFLGKKVGINILPSSHLQDEGVHRVKSKVKVPKNK